MRQLARRGRTISAVGSITKGMVGVVAQSMVERGLLAWRDTLEELLPREAELSADARKITLRQLATHTSGLPRQPNTFETLRLFVQYLDTLCLRAFSRANPALASKYERSTGHAGDQPKMIRRGQPVADWRMNSFMLGAYSSPRGLIRYAGGHFLANPVHSSMAHTLGNGQPSVAWLDDPLRENGIYYQFGVNSGHSTFVGIDLTRRIAVVVLQNSFNWSDSVGRNPLRRPGRAEDLKNGLDSANCAASQTSGRDGYGSLPN